MSDEFYAESVDTEEIEELVEQILRRFGEPYPQDITDRVFLAIEQDPNKRKRYEIFAGQDLEGTTNQWIGKLVKEYTGLKVKGICNDPKSTLIKMYSMLGR
jgi:tRNA uridine 5-carbamoylmethylation protein Kti12